MQVIDDDAYYEALLRDGWRRCAMGQRITQHCAEAERQRQQSDAMFSAGARLALDLECMLLETRDTAAVSKWWDSAHEALEQWRQAVLAMEAAIDAAQPEASTTLEQAESHAHICAKLAEQYKSDPVLFAALTDAAAIILDLMRDRLGASATGAGQAEIEALRAEVDRMAEALRGWWEAHRPVGWTEDQHRSCPHVNLATDTEKALATALLRYQEERQ